MFKIIDAQFIAPGIKRFILEAPPIARRQKPGQFVILRIYEEGERIPVTIENHDLARGTISIVVQSAGKTACLPNSLQTGDHILDVVGPLGKPSCGVVNLTLQTPHQFVLHRRRHVGITVLVVGQGGDMKVITFAGIRHLRYSVAVRAGEAKRSTISVEGVMG